MSIHPLGSGQPAASVPVYHILVDCEGHLLYANPAFRNELDEVKSSSTSFPILIAQSNRDAFYAAVKECLAQKGEPLAVQLQMQSPGSRALAISWEFSAERSSVDGKMNIRAVGVPAFYEREAGFRQLRELINNLPLGIILQDEKGKPVLYNPAALNMLQVSGEQLEVSHTFQSAARVMHEGRGLFLQGILPGHLVVETLKPVRNALMKIRLDSGRDYSWLQVHADPVFDEAGHLCWVVSSFTDITQEKKLAKRFSDRAIQQHRQFTQATIDAHEHERMELGKELHENINQHLTAARLYLEVAKEGMGGEAHDMLNFSYKKLGAIIHDIRRLSQSLVPSSLRDIGLVESLQDLAASFERIHKITVTCHWRHFDESQLPERIKLMLYRVTQERLNNLLQHQGTVSVEIRLQSDAEFITLTITGDGVEDERTHRKGATGFQNIAHRVSLFNGTTEQTLLPGKGTLLTVHIPAIAVQEPVEN